MATTYTTGGLVWTVWASTSASTCDTSSTWSHWCDTASTSSCGTTATVWHSWTCDTSATPVRYYAPPAQRLQTPEERAKADADRLAREEAYRLAEAERAKKQREADARAEELLRRHLTLRQRRAYRRDRAFTVRARDGTSYRIKHGWAGNVEELNRAGRPVARLCIHPRESVPVADNLLAQKFMLETDPEAFRKIANRTVLPQAV